MNDTTIDYYNNNAESFISNTIDCEFSEMQDKFLNYLDNNAKILDLGCGSGRDSKYFLNKGFNITALDGSQELCKVAENIIGQKVVCQDFRNLDYNNEFDGIWACASLLHLRKEEIKTVIIKCIEALKTNGIFYCSFKYGNYEGNRNGRYFTDLTEEEFNKVISKINNIQIEEVFVSNDVRKGRENEQWLNIFIKKLSNSPH